MARRVQWRRGTTAQHSVFVGAPGEITIDTDKKVVVVHDGVTPGGFPAVVSTNPTFGGNASFAGIVNINSAIASTSVSTGSLVINGGLGVSGRLTVNNIVETSSIQFKENIKPIENALEMILQLEGVLYDRKDQSELNESGLIAEQVNEVFPSLVTKDDEGKPYGVKYTKLVAYLVEAIKEQQSQILDLNKRIQDGLSS